MNEASVQDLFNLRNQVIQCFGEVDHKTLKVEQFYQVLNSKENKTSDEIFLHSVLKQVRDSFLSAKENMSFLHKEFCIYNFDWDGSPISDWEFHIKRIYFPKHVNSEVIDGYHISTVWLGMDHSYFNNDNILIFETMIFNREGESTPYQERYSTYEEAVEGHKKACEEVRSFKPT